MVLSHALFLVPVLLIIRDSPLLFILYSGNQLFLDTLDLVQFIEQLLLLFMRQAYLAFHFIPVRVGQSVNPLQILILADLLYEFSCDLSVFFFFYFSVSLHFFKLCLINTELLFTTFVNFFDMSNFSLQFLFLMENILPIRVLIGEYSPCVSSHFRI